MPHAILVADDDHDLRATIADQLTAQGGYAVSQATTAAQAGALATRPGLRLDAILLDVGLPDGDGRDLCNRLRRHGVRIPILMLSGAGDEGSLVRGLDAGANDYLVKPVRMGELLARLRAQIRSFSGGADPELQVGPYAFRPARRQLIPAQGRPIRLTDKEAGVLLRLHEAGERPVTRAQLLRDVWGYHASADTHTVETHIYRLRRKLEPVPGEIRLLVNVGGAYVLNRDVIRPMSERFTGRIAFELRAS